MTALANFCILSHGWRRFLLLFAAGAVAGLSVPPLFILPALFLGLPILVWCLDGAERMQGWRRIFGPSFLIGFAFGFGYFAVAIHWIGGAFFVDGGLWLIVMPFAVLALAGLLAVFWGLGTALAHLFWLENDWRLLALAAAMTAAEFARGHVLSGFPFDLPGYALTANEQMMQLTSVIGVYGLTFFAFLIAATPALIWPADERNLPARLAPLFAALVFLAAQLGYGQYRLDTTEIDTRNDVRMRLVQPNIAQAVKWEAENGNFSLQRLIETSEAKTLPNAGGLVTVSHVIWPESALPFYLSEHPEALARIARMLPAGTMLITGMPRLESDGPGLPARAFNSILAIDSDGEIVDSYDKTHLVPFGEYLPFGDLLARIGLRQFVAGNEGWTAGQDRRIMAPGGMPGFVPLVCYEAVFSGDLGPVSDAGFLLNLTNDGWFDNTIGPAQHFHHARVRAVEEGRPLVRVANTGTTGMVDPLGHITASLQRQQMGVLDVSLPQRLPTTVFAQLRHWPLLGLEIASLVVLVGFKAAGLRRNRRRRKATI